MEELEENCVNPETGGRELNEEPLNMNQEYQSLVHNTQFVGLKMKVALPEWF
jgi:hypothetical protein